MLLGRPRLGTHTVLENVHKSILGFGEDLGDQEKGKGECWKSGFLHNRSVEYILRRSNEKKISAVPESFLFH